MKLTRFFLLISILFTLCGSALRAEYVFLKDGSIIKCTVESETPKGTVVRLPDGKMKSFSPKEIIRTLYTDLYMGKIHIQKVDGSTVEAYMVDEDQQSFTLRKDLYKPVEFILKRDEVLFTTRKNPIGLEGTAETDRLILKWKPPYTPMKEYNIYIKSGKDYILAGKSGSTSFTVKGVKSNTIYAVKVTATDDDGVETLPTNEIKVKTMNIQPEPPKNVRVERKADADKKTFTAFLAWDAGLSVDGKIKGYRILVKEGMKLIEIGFATKNEFELKNIESGRNYFFTLRTIDVNGWESDNSRLVNTLPLGVDFSLEGNYIIPLGKFKDIHKSGYGGLLRAVKTNFPFYNFETGITFGYWQFGGTSTDTGKVNNSYIIPLLAAFDYRLEFFSIFSIVPKVSMGLSYNEVHYQAEPELYTGYGLTQIKKDKSAIEPMALAGLSLQCVLFDRWIVSAGADYGMIYEKSGMMKFITANIGAGIKF
jgi:hypothetical protein